MKTRFFDTMNEEALAFCAAAIQNGELVAFPTETVYGLGADAANTAAVEKIYLAKGRESDNPLIVHFSCAEEIFSVARVEDTELFEALAQAFMPGPLTLVLPRRDVLSPRVSAGLSTVAVRVPSHEGARAFLRACKVPVAAPSANRSHRPSPTCAAHVLEDMDGRIAAVLDGGECEHGVESTVLSLCGGELRLLRPGAVTVEMIEAVTERDVVVDRGVLAHVADGERVASPGMKYRHYAPRAPLTAVVGEDALVRAFFQNAEKREDVGILCFEEDLAFLKRRESTLTLGAAQDSRRHARCLFSALRTFDTLPLSHIYTRLPGEGGVGLAVNNRLLRACEFDVLSLKTEE